MSAEPEFRASRPERGPGRDSDPPLVAKRDSGPRAPGLDGIRALDSDRPAGKAKPEARRPEAADPDIAKPPGKREPDAATKAAIRRRRRRRRRLSPLTRRILALNVLAIAIPVAGLLYLGDYRDDLVKSQLAGLRTQAELFAGALGTSGVVTGPLGEEKILPETTRHTVRRLVDVSKVRARLFDSDGILLADSFKLVGPSGQVDIEVLPPQEQHNLFGNLVADIYDWVIAQMPGNRRMPLYREAADQKAEDYPEAERALQGETAEMVRSNGAGGMILSVAVPVQRYRQVLGALMVSTDGREIEDSLRRVRLGILKVFAVAAAITTLLSLYLAGTIARPIHRLAEAADRVRRVPGRQVAIPDFGKRKDEIGDLAEALRDMTNALWQRMDAIERFAADVAHEIKNPLTSLRSAVETVARIEDPVQQKKLMGIILDDVQRLNRLITDISDASRLDAELSRAESEPIDLPRLLQALADLHENTIGQEGPRLVLDIAERQGLEVMGIESRLVQVLRNLIANAVSFSPPDGRIRLACGRQGDMVRILVEDGGPGIPPGKLEAIFERFYSERPKAEKFGAHSGLGLSISKQIVEAQGGRIWAENIEDAHGEILGARFVILLPAREHQPRDRQPRDRQSRDWQR
ncbi:histidine kinase [Hypericibacter terrae]|uniref:histidine kinase n=1 Tax=Hypericibacter terrae TaxID=2602015 RepID=A0A5J6MC82_9PROT|nr:stimulus-sensing domain-containing protein [Hypericibacter terrae]QEX14864.1 histidine kinase [Hypericibacter terrae]